MGSTRVSGAPACGLYIAMPPSFKLEEAVKQLRHIFFITTRSNYERNMHVIEITHEADAPDFIDRATVIAALGRNGGFTVILRGQGAEIARVAQIIEADGVLLDRYEEIAPARAILGDEAIVGLRCGLSPERADEAKQAGVDYVSFGYPDRGQLPPEDVIKLWAWRDETPVLVEGPVTNDDCDDYIRAGATFFDAGDYIFNHPEGIPQATVNMLYAIDLALGVQS